MPETIDRAELLKRLSPGQRVQQKKAAPARGGQDIPRRTKAGPIPLSFSQQRLWFITQVDSDSSLYNVPEAIELTGPLNVAALEQSFSEITRRHDAVRPGRKQPRLERPHQTPRDIVDLDPRDARSRQRELERLSTTRRIRRRP